MRLRLRSCGVLLPLLALLPVVAGACAAPPPVDRADWDRRAQRLLEPLLADVDVGCGELLIEISPNYFANVSQPAVDPNLHGVRRRSEDGYDEYVWFNKVGDHTGAFLVTIGAPDEITDEGLVRGRGTRFTVLHEVRLRVHSEGEIQAQLDVSATGQPLVWNKGGAVRDLAEFRVSNGVLQAR